MLKFVPARLLEYGMIRVQRGADGKPLIACCWLEVRPAKRRAVKQFAVGHAVERASSRKREILARNLLMQMIQQVEEYLFKSVLQRKGQIHVSLRNFGVRLARFAEQPFHLLGEMPCQANRTIRQNLHALIAAKRFEVTEIKLQPAVLWRYDLADFIAVRCLAVRRKAHHLTFVAILRVANEFANHRVYASERVWEEDTIENLYVAALATRHHRGNEIARAVVAEACSFLPRRAIVRTGDVCDVVLKMMFLKTELRRICIERVG